MRLLSLVLALCLLACAAPIQSTAPLTFGSPRVGDGAFAATFREAATRKGVRSLRVRNGNDAVTRLPGLFLEYEHVGTLVHLEESKLAIGPDPEPAYNGSSIADHDIAGFAEGTELKSGYYRRLLQISQNRTYPELTRCDDPE